MKIAILTQPLRYNYGGIMQNFALQTILRRMGHVVVTLDHKRYNYHWWQRIRYSIYISWYDFLSRYLNGKLLDKKHFVLFSIDYLFCHILFRNIRWRIIDEKKEDRITHVLGTNTFQFVDKFISRKEYNKLESDVSPTDYDVFVVGSDQVWRPEYNTNLSNMFLDFTKKWNVSRIAYSASFGVDVWNADDDLTKRCKQLLKSFDSVSVRESSGVKLCKDVFDVDAIQMLDPTLLLKNDDYISLLHLDKVPKSNGNLLVYILDNTEDKQNLVQRIVNDYNLMPFRVNSDVEDYTLTDLSRRIQPPVEQWMRGFYDAEYVITDSFHACIFSIIFGKPFVVYANDKRGSTRYESLLHQFSMMECMVSKSEDFHGFCNCSQDNIKSLEELRDKSIDFLRNNLV